MLIKWLRNEPSSTVENKIVLLRADLNVPIEQGTVRNEHRLRRLFGTLELLANAGARTVIVSHLESGEGNPTLAPIAQFLGKFFSVEFFPGPLEQVRARAGSLKPGSFLLLENVRRYAGEKQNAPAFAAQLASMADIYVNDAFAVSHRSHASIVGVPTLLPHFGGLLFEEEVEELGRAFHPEKPFVAVFGGAKCETKIPILEKLSATADELFVYGAIANTFLKAAGHEIGLSPHEASQFDAAERVMSGGKVVLPIDVVVVANDTASTKDVSMVEEHDRIVDIGPRSIEQFAKSAHNARLILWNGPLGKYEEGFTGGTEALAQAIANSGVYSLVGGGDTIATLPEKVSNRFGFVSTGGGAMLDYLAHGTLPGIAALEA